MGATACIVVPAYLDYFEKTGDWASLAWWIHAHIPAYSSLRFFPNLCAFNISWYENKQSPKYIKTYVEDPNTSHKKHILMADVESDYYRSIPLKQRYAACEKLLKSKSS